MNTKNPVLTVLIIAVLLFLNLGLSSASASPTIAQAQSTTLFVKPGEEGDCFSWETACDLQDALALAEAGDQVWVAAGIYKPTTGTDRTVTFLLESGVAIYGGFAGTETSLAERDWDTNLTTLSGDIGAEDDIADNSFHVVTGSGLSDTAILDGFTITAANANVGFPAEPVGGGMYLLSSSPTLKNIIISGNLASYGGGMQNQSGSPTLTNVTFSNNTAIFRGGGMYNLYSSNPTLTNVTFSSNSAGDSGGGMYNYESSSPTLTNATFSGNTVNGNGGGMFNQFSSSPTLNNVVFSDNTATSWGGGIHNSSNCNPNLTNVLFSGNSAGDAGGGMVNENSNPTITHTTFFNNTAYNGGGMGNSSSSPTLTNVTFSGNTATVGGGGMSNYYFSGIMTNVTFYGNTASSGGAMKSERSSPTVTNSIFWGNTPDQLSFIVHSYPVITYSIIQGETVWDGIGNDNSDPLLVGLADNGGFTQTHALGDSSPAIDAGSPTLCPAMDQRGFHRPIDGDENTSAICDMGAYEYASYPEVFTLTVDAEGNGSVAIDPDQTEYQFGEIVSLTALADPGWSFSGWSGDATGTTNPLTISMLHDTSITANFEQVIFKIYLPLIVR